MPIISRTGKGAFVKRTASPKRRRQPRVQLIEYGRLSGYAPGKTGPHADTVQATFDRQRRLVEAAKELGIDVRGKSWVQLGKAVSVASRRAAQRAGLDSRP